LSLTAPADENKETTINQFALKMVSQSRPHNRELNSFISSIRGTPINNRENGNAPILRLSSAFDMVRQAHQPLRQRFLVHSFLEIALRLKQSIALNSNNPTKPN
jgi:hypothetical protein